ncbi:MAG: hypothetical protein LAP86_29905 [Acidobacteriia bacterium]|nr:hypothetical protein [Terriglobia bacterium]
MVRVIPEYVSLNVSAPFEAAEYPLIWPVLLVGALETYTYATGEHWPELRWIQLVRT